jgi:hypothetical protein
VIAYDVSTGRALRELQVDGHAITALRCPPSGTSLIVGTKDGAVKVRNLVDGRVTRDLPPTGSAITALAVTSDRVVFVRSERQLRSWNLVSGEVTDLGDAGAITCLDACRGADPQIVAATNDGHVQYLQASRMKTVADLPAEFGGAIAVALSQDGRTAVFANRQGAIFAYDVVGRHGIGTFQAGILDLTSLAFLPDGVLLWVVGASGNAELLDVRQGHSVAQTRFSPSGVTALAFSSDGRHAVLLGTDGGASACDFGRAATQHALEGRVTAARTALDKGADPDGSAAAAFGEWYAFRGKADWAIDFLRQAESQGAAVSHLAAARCYWLEGRHADAIRELDRALERGEVSLRYHALCTNALKNEPKAASTAPTAPAVP